MDRAAVAATPRGRRDEDLHGTDPHPSPYRSRGQEDFRYVATEELVRLGVERAHPAISPVDAAAAKEAGLAIWKRLWGPDGEWGALRAPARRPIAAVRGQGGCRSLFVHAGVTPRHLATLLEAGAHHADLVGALNRAFWDDGHYSWTRGDDTGPVWTRAYGEMRDETKTCGAVQAVLEAVGAKHMVVGHTIQFPGNIQVRCRGAVLLIDTGASYAYRNDAPWGRVSAAECVAGSWYALYEDGKTLLVRDESGLPDDEL